MAKGKEALSAANRRLEAAYAHIDRLTSELVDAKIRARLAEQRATKLEGVDALVTQADIRRDQTVTQLQTEVNHWEQVSKEFDGWRRDALVELLGKVFLDLKRDGAGLPHTIVDRMEFVRKRYPVLWDLLAMKSTTNRPRPDAGTMRRFHGDRLLQLQRALGHRATLPPEVEVDTFAELYSEILDAEAAGLTSDEVLNLVFKSGSAPASNGVTGQ